MPQPTVPQGRPVAGWIAVILATLFTTLWIFWGTAELFYEGWGLPFPNYLYYLIPGVACLILSVGAVMFPLVGGWLLIIAGTVFTAWWFNLQISRGADWVALLSITPASALIVVTGLLFLFDARRRRLLRLAGVAPSGVWWKRHLRVLVTAGVPLLVAVITAASNLPTVLTRHDDGYTGTRVIEGNGVTLVWAPEGPGWNWLQDFGGYPSWNSLALYGMEPIGLDWHGKLTADTGNATSAHMDSCGLCAYLSEDGHTLLDTPIYVWRMPTTDEIVRSLCIDGHHAGCTWDGESSSANCAERPDKQSPLWNPNEQPVYYWTADEVDSGMARFVNYNGFGIHSQPKGWGNPRHGYRCVREVRESDRWDSLGRLQPVIDSLSAR